MKQSNNIIMSNQNSQLLAKITINSQEPFEGRPSFSSPRYSYNPSQLSFKNPILGKIQKKRPSLLKTSQTFFEKQMCRNCRKNLAEIKMKLKNQIQELKQVSDAIRETIQKNMTILMNDLKLMKNQAAKQIKQILGSTSVEIEERNFRLQIENYYKQEQIKQLKAQLSKKGNKTDTVFKFEEKEESGVQKLENFLDRSKLAMANFQKTKKKVEDPHKTLSRKKERSSIKKESASKDKRSGSVQEKINKLQNYVQKGIVLAKGEEMNFNL